MTRPLARYIAQYILHRVDTAQKINENIVVFEAIDAYNKEHEED